MAIIVTFRTPQENPLHCGPYEQIEFRGGEIIHDGGFSEEPLATYEKFTGAWLVNGKRYASVFIQAQP